MSEAIKAVAIAFSGVVALLWLLNEASKQTDDFIDRIDDLID